LEWSRFLANTFTLKITRRSVAGSATPRKKARISGSFAQLMKKGARSYEIALEDAAVLCYIALCITCLKLLIESRIQ
jgi:hypothetical protein